MTKLASCLTVLLAGAVLGSVALAQQQKPAAPPATPPPPPPAAPAATPPTAGAPDMTKMGPLARPVTKEDKKGIDATYKAMLEAWKSGDVNAAAELVDFPVIMLSDDSTGAPKHFSASREQWVAMMKPMAENMPKDVKMSHKHQAHFLSDTLAVAIEENGMQHGKVKGKWKSLSVLTLRDGKWKFKEMAEAGWGDMAPPQAVGANVPAAPRK